MYESAVSDKSALVGGRFPVVGGLSNIQQIAAGNDHSLALDDQGTLWAWGKNDEGQLGTEVNRAATTVRVR